MAKSKKKIALINGPNLNRLGRRKPELYGKETLGKIISRLEKQAAKSGFEIVSTQSQSEGILIEAIEKAANDCVGIIINPGAYAHTSIALRDALEDLSVPVIEVHLSNIFKREEFRRHSYVSEVARGAVVGLGALGYLLALEALTELLRAK